MPIIRGALVARSIIESLKNRPRPDKKIMALYVGEDASSLSFLKQKRKVAEELGIPFELLTLPEKSPEGEARAALVKIAADASVGGIILQLPLPSNYDREAFFRIIPPKKDVDNLAGHASVLMPSALTVAAIIRETQFDLKEKKAVVVGRGFLIGEPVERWLTGQVGALTVIDRGGDYSALATADLVISGVGKAALIKADRLKSGALVIDFGYDLAPDGKLVGDFDPAGAEERAILYTPTPGGTGPILVAKLFENFYALNS